MRIEQRPIGSINLKAYFDGIKPFNGSPEGWRPYEAYGKESAL